MSTHFAWALFSKIWGRVSRGKKYHQKLSSKINKFGMKTYRISMKFLKFLDTVLLDQSFQIKMSEKLSNLPKVPEIGKKTGESFIMFDGIVLKYGAIYLPLQWTSPYICICSPGPDPEQ